MNKKLYIYFLIGLPIGVLLAFIIKLSFVPLYSKSIEADVSATLISGILGMFGGVVGAIAAFFAASYQIKKQFEKKDKDRIIELRIEKQTETLNFAQEFLNVLYSWSSSFSRSGQKIRFHMEENHLEVLENPKSLITNELEDLQNRMEKLESYRIPLYKNRIFLDPVKVEGLFGPFMEMKPTCDRYISKMNSEVLKCSELDEVTNELRGYYYNLEETIRDFINELEKNIQKLLNTN